MARNSFVQGHTLPRCTHEYTSTGTHAICFAVSAGLQQGAMFGVKSLPSTAAFCLVMLIGFLVKICLICLDVVCGTSCTGCGFTGAHAYMPSFWAELLSS